MRPGPQKAGTAQPTMPVISGESRYEALEITPGGHHRRCPAGFLGAPAQQRLRGPHLWRQRRVAGEPRERALWQFAQWPQLGRHTLAPGHAAARLHRNWRGAKALLLTLPWHRLEPIALPSISKLRRFLKRHFRLDVSASRSQQPVAAAATSDGDVAIFYFLNAKPIAIAQAHFSQPFDGFWFDPASGETAPIRDFQRMHQNHTPMAPPGHNSAHDTDWVLVVHKRGQVDGQGGSRVRSTTNGASAGV